MIKTSQIIIVVLISALASGGGIYLWQQSILEKAGSENEQQKNELQQQVDGLQTQLNDLQSRLNQITAEKDSLQQQINALTKVPERYVKVVVPNGGETLCLDENFVIKWDSKGVDVISLNILKLEGIGATSYPLGTFPATLTETGETGKGDYVWKVGSTSGGIKLREGYGYKIEIMSADGVSITDTSNKVFQILLCQG